MAPSTPAAATAFRPSTPLTPVREPTPAAAYALGVLAGVALGVFACLAAQDYLESRERFIFEPLVVTVVRL